MMGATASLNTKIDLQEKRDFQANAEALGMTPSAAIKVFVRMFNQCKGFPFDVRLQPRINFDNSDIAVAEVSDGRVWQMSFEYEDQPGVAKVRPVVIGAVDGGRAVVLAVKVTGHGPRPEFPGEVRLRGWKDAGLDKPSVARCSKTLVVPTEVFVGQMRYGHLNEEDALAVAEALREVGATL